MPTPGQSSGPPPGNPFADLITGGQQPSANPFGDLVPKGPGLPETILDQASRGMSLGFAPQLMGGIKAVEGAGKYMYDTMSPTSGGSWSGLGDAISKGYTGGRDALRAQYDQEAQVHPAISRAADIGGSIGGALVSGGGSLVGPMVEEAAPRIGANMLGRVVTRGTIPAIEAGAERAIGETRDDNYGGNIIKGVPLSVLFGTALGTAGQLAGSAQAAGTGAATKGALYDAANAAEITDPVRIDQLRRATDPSSPAFRPSIAEAYTRAERAAQDAGDPLPGLPPAPSPAPYGNAPNSTSGTGPGPFSEGLPIRTVDLMKRALDKMKANGEIDDPKAYDWFKANFVTAADAASPQYGAARQAAGDVIRGRELTGALTSAGKSPVSTVLGGAAGMALGHNPLTTGAGALGGRLINAMASQPAVADATAGPWPALATASGRALAAQGARTDDPRAQAAMQQLLNASLARTGSTP
jgi:hypothetical protein